MINDRAADVAIQTRAVSTQQQRPQQRSTQQDVQARHRAVQHQQSKLQLPKGLSCAYTQQRTAQQSGAQTQRERNPTKRCAIPPEEDPRGVTPTDVRSLKSMDAKIRPLMSDAASSRLFVYDPENSCFAHMTLLEGIGSGTFGTVYKVHLEGDSDKFYAAKLLRPYMFESSARKRVVEMFVSEIANYHAVQCPSVVPIKRIIRGLEGWCLVMDYIPGKKTLWEAYKCENESDVFAIMIQLIQGLMVCYEKEVVHRDLKPTNVLKAPNGRIYIADFGWSERFDSLNKNPDELPGTLEINPPEILYKRPEQSAKVDVYALGLTLLLLMSNIFIRRVRHATIEQAKRQILGEISQVRKGEMTQGFTQDSWELFRNLTSFSPKDRCSLFGIFRFPWVIKQLRQLGLRSFYHENVTLSDGSQEVAPPLVWHPYVKRLILEGCYSEAPRHLTLEDFAYPSEKWVVQQGAVITPSGKIRECITARPMQSRPGTRFHRYMDFSRQSTADQDATNGATNNAEWARTKKIQQQQQQTVQAGEPPIRDAAEVHDVTTTTGGVDAFSMETARESDGTLKLNAVEEKQQRLPLIKATNMMQDSANAGLFHGAVMDDLNSSASSSLSITASLDSDSSEEGSTAPAKNGADVYKGAKVRPSDDAQALGAPKLDLINARHTSHVPPLHEGRTSPPLKLSSVNEQQAMSDAEMHTLAILDAVSACRQQQSIAVARASSQSRLQQRQQKQQRQQSNQGNVVDSPALLCQQKADPSGTTSISLQGTTTASSDTPVTISQQEGVSATGGEFIERVAGTKRCEDAGSLIDSATQFGARLVNNIAKKFSFEGSPSAPRDNGKRLPDSPQTAGTGVVPNKQRNLQKVVTPCNSPGTSASRHSAFFRGGHVWSGCSTSARSGSSSASSSAEFEAPSPQFTTQSRADPTVAQDDSAESDARSSSAATAGSTTTGGFGLTCSPPSPSVLSLGSPAVEQDSCWAATTPESLTDRRRPNTGSRVPWYRLPFIIAMPKQHQQTQRQRSNCEGSPAAASVSLPQVHAEEQMVRKLEEARKTAPMTARCAPKYYDMYEQLLVPGSDEKTRLNALKLPGPKIPIDNGLTEIYGTPCRTASRATTIAMTRKIDARPCLSKASGASKSPFQFLSSLRSGSMNDPVVPPSRKSDVPVCQMKQQNYHVGGCEARACPRQHLAGQQVQGRSSHSGDLHRGAALLLAERQHQHQHQQHQHQPQHGSDLRESAALQHQQQATRHSSRVATQAARLSVRHG